MKIQAGRRQFIRQGLTSAMVLGWAPGTIFGQIKSPIKPLRMVIASDGHFGQPNTDFEAFHRQLMDHVLQLHREKPLDAVVFNGDLVHDRPELLPEVKKYYAQLGIPYYVTQGNHDRASASLWESVWGYGPNHVVKLGNQALVLANTSDEKGAFLCPDTGWIKQQLSQLKDVAGIHLFLHITPNKWTDWGVACLPLQTVLLEHQQKHHNILAVYNGHDHDQDHVKFVDQIPYLFDGHFGGNWGLDYRGYRMVEVSGAGKLYTQMRNGQAVVRETFL